MLLPTYLQWTHAVDNSELTPNRLRHAKNPPLPPPAGDHRFHQLHQLVVKWIQAGLYIPNDAPTACVFLAEDVRRVLSRVLHCGVL